MDVKFCKAFRDEMQLALESVEEKMGVKISIGTIKFTATDLVATITAEETPEDGTSLEESKFKHLSVLYGFRPEDYMSEVIISDDVYYFIGFSPKARSKRGLIRRIHDGVVFKASLESIKNGLNKSK